MTSWETRGCDRWLEGTACRPPWRRTRWTESEDAPRDRRLPPAVPGDRLFPVFFFYPIGLEFWASLYSGQPLIGESQFAGFDNYMTALQDARVRQSVFVTLAFAIGVTAASIAIGLGLAVLLNRPIPGRTAIRAIIFFPYIISFVIVALMWKAFSTPIPGY